MKQTMLFVLTVLVLCNGEPRRCGRRFLVSPINSDVTRISVAERHTNRQGEEQKSLTDILENHEMPTFNKPMQQRSQILPQAPGNRKQEIEGLD